MLLVFSKNNIGNINRIYVVTVCAPETATAAMAMSGLHHLAEKAEGWIRQGIRKAAEKMCARLRDAGYDAEPPVFESDNPREAISKTSNAVRGLLIVLNSGPHGFWSRLFSESVDEGILANDPPSLLILRP